MGRAQYLIAMCDILGFSKFVEEHPLDDVVQLGIGGLRAGLHVAMYGHAADADPPVWSHFAQHEHVGAAWFSDTILLYTKRDDDVAIRELLGVVNALLFYMVGGATRTRIRAGLAYGEAYIDPGNAMFVGQPIIDAFRMEQSQEWSGGALHESAVDRVASIPDITRWWLVPYAVPGKDGKPVATLALDWNRGVHERNWRLTWSADSAEPTVDDWIKQPDVCRKFVYTKRFHEQFCTDCNPVSI